MNQKKKNIEEGAGDLPGFLVGPVESHHVEESPAESCASSLKSIAHHDERSQPINYQFSFHEVLGKGGFSKVKKAIHRASGQTYAVKILEKCKIQNGEFPRVILEIETLASVKHPCICKLYSAFYTSTKIYMVMEYCFTDLYEYLIKLLKPMPEARAWKIFVQLLAAISYLHSIGIVHRDIKPENILLTGNMRIKLSDFGFAAKIPRNRSRYLSTYCGSLAYGAPEILAGTPYCGERADIWSLGVNLYVLLSNKQPFWSKNANEVRAQVMTARFQFPCHFGKRSRNLISLLLQVNPIQRPRIAEIWQDPWIQQRDPKDLFKQLQYDISTEYPYASSAHSEVIEAIALNQVYKPTCRNEPVQVEVPNHRARIRLFITSTQKVFSNLKDLVLCRRS